MVGDDISKEETKLLAGGLHIAFAKRRKVRSELYIDVELDAAGRTVGEMC